MPIINGLKLAGGALTKPDNDGGWAMNPTHPPQSVIWKDLPFRTIPGVGGDGGIGGPGLSFLLRWAKFIITPEGSGTFNGTVTTTGSENVYTGGAAVDVEDVDTTTPFGPRTVTLWYHASYGAPSSNSYVVIARLHSKGTDTRNLTIHSTSGIGDPVMPYAVVDFDVDGSPGGLLINTTYEIWLLVQRYANF